jgi:hypothetical protein
MLSDPEVYSLQRDQVVDNKDPREQRSDKKPGASDTRMGQRRKRGEQSTIISLATISIEFIIKRGASVFSHSLDG